MPQTSICLTQLADDLESHGNLLALLSELPTAELSERGRVGFIQFSNSLLKDFEKIENDLSHYRASMTPNC